MGWPTLLRTAILSVLVAGLPGGAGGKSGKQHLEGAWQVTSIECDGEKAPAEAIKGLIYMYKGDHLRIAPAEPGSNSQFTVKLDQDRRPKTMSLKITKGPAKGHSLLGIYDVEGDCLKICYGEKNRPMAFESKEKSGVALVILKRKTAQ